MPIYVKLLFAAVATFFLTPFTGEWVLLTFLISAGLLGLVFVTICIDILRGN